MSSNFLHQLNISANLKVEAQLAVGSSALEVSSTLATQMQASTNPGTLSIPSSVTPVPARWLQSPTLAATSVIVPGDSTVLSMTDPRLAQAINQYDFLALLDVSVISPLLSSLLEILYHVGTTIKGTVTSGPSFETGQLIQNLSLLALGAVSEVGKVKASMLKDYPFSADAIHHLSTRHEVSIANHIPSALTIPLVDNSLPWSSVATLSNTLIPSSAASICCISQHQPIIACSAFTSLPSHPIVLPPSPVQGFLSTTAIPMSPSSLTGTTPKVCGLVSIPVVPAPQLTATWVENQHSDGPFPHTRIEFDPRSSSYCTVSIYNHCYSD
ncbi:hypothetical protein GYMLUDRAFT_61787 [Collybiopsis luxurians FD-317 M1]|uniref:Unplaced genomic scaffold GYMLUscaffold_47, whole genome shotgun sequence n=1 Tax=Collybiopsis luxurians FD-317 M1 TaxID=944289 RepID=A0A0D0CF69_9AGAR|nr:hypothetical protein GYMLUDRAFT_61787 [Collybiopsis luxurians FD-317 M1]